MNYGFTSTDLATSKWLRRQVPMRYSGSSSGVLACIVWKEIKDSLLERDRENKVEFHVNNQKQ